MKKYGALNNSKNKGENIELQDEEIKFILWKAELNRELLSFWKSMSE